MHVAVYPEITSSVLVDDHGSLVMRMKIQVQLTPTSLSLFALALRDH